MIWKNETKAQKINQSLKSIKKLNQSSKNQSELKKYQKVEQNKSLNIRKSHQKVNKDYP